MEGGSEERWLGGGGGGEPVPPNMPTREEEVGGRVRVGSMGEQ